MLNRDKVKTLLNICHTGGGHENELFLLADYSQLNA